MREIKFRAWDKDRNRYIGSAYPHNWNNDKDEWYADVDKMDLIGIENISSNDMFVVEQFTGLRDKNGREIYEGDIIVSPNIIKEGAVVKWYDYSWSIGNCWPFGDYESMYIGFDFEVIGNIHENPELLK